MWTSVLWNAVREGNIDAATRALCMGGDMEHLNGDGETVLRLAVCARRLDIVKILRVNGANFNVESKDGLMHLHCAASNNDIKMMAYLVEIIGVDVNYVSRPHGSPPLTMAVRFTSFEAMKFLLQHGAHINAVGHRGLTALMAATMVRPPAEKFIIWLIKAGAALRITTEQLGPPEFRGCCTAESLSIMLHPDAYQTRYLTAKTHCSNPACDKTGIKKCTGCRWGRYCGKACQVVHWTKHKQFCKSVQLDLDLRSTSKQ
jgi:hypothetical protein